MTDPAPVTILGAGYVGAALLKRLPDADATHRHAASGPRIHPFDLDDPTTWRNPPLAGRQVVWTFPATPPERVQAFFDCCLRDVTGLIVLGSTSAYRIGDDETVPAVDEDFPLDLDQPRVAGEEWLRARGATVLQLAGIFGPGREPVDWLRRGRIRDGAKLVNLIHVDDIVVAVSHLLAHPAPGNRINVANGEPVTWRDLAARFRSDNRLSPDFELPENGPGETGKRIDNRRLRELLTGHVFRKP